MDGSDGARRVLVINSGSSSLKFQLVDPESGVAASTGIVERIGEESSPVPDHDAALRRAFDMLAGDGVDLNTAGLVAVGHRVVHGGNTFYRPTVLDDAVIARLHELSELAPLHNPPALQGIEVARRLLPGIAHVAVFDTGFFHDLPPAAATYAIDRELADRWQIRRYGFHGTSHRYVSEQAAAFLIEAARPETDRAAPGQRLLGVGDRRHPAPRHLDGVDAAGGTGDGNPQR